MTNIIRAGRLAILLSTGLTLMLSVLFSGIGAQDEPADAVNNADRRDNLAYVTEDHHLMLYNPRDRTETKLLDNVQRFVIARDGRVVFTRYDEGDPQLADTDLYVFDPSTPLLAPINISQNPAAGHFPLAWSPDGKYLAFASYMDKDNHILYVWDGETITSIMPEDGLDTADTFYVDWSNDGRLAFTIQHGWLDSDIPSEVYLWDGSTTINLSQNPEYWDGNARWSQTGQLKFGSERDGKPRGVYVWDGTSFKGESPDTESFIRLPFEQDWLPTTWTDEDYIGLAWYSEGSLGGPKEIILWNPESQAVVKRFPVTSENAWSWLAEGGQAILSSQLASGIPSVYLDVENTEGEIGFSNHVGEFAWSSDGYLAYCGIEEGRSRVLSIWDGSESWVVARVSYKPIQWLYERDTFSCNNG